MDGLIKCCENFETYPLNLDNQSVSSYRLRSYFDRLQDLERQLFDLSAMERVNNHFLTTASFIHAPHSRAALQISRDIFGFLFSYHQILPSFLDFMFPFGKQEYVQDFYFGGLREENRLCNDRRGAPMPDLGRSGGDLRFYYSLRSVERSPGRQGFQWSIQQTAIYHSFDIETGRCLWVNVKGNELMKNRFFEAADSFEGSKWSSRNSAFLTSLSTHMMICEWAVENWAWYINDLQDELQASSTVMLAASLDTPPIPISIYTTENPCDSNTSVEFSGITSSITQMLRSNVSDSEWLDSNRKEAKTQSSGVSPIAKGKIITGDIVPQKEHNPLILETFPFRDLLNVQYIKEKLYEVQSVLRLNIEVLRDLKQLYHSAVDHTEFPKEVTTACERELVRFKENLERIEKDLRVQHLKTETLLQILADRKAILHSSLSYQNMKTSESMAEKTQTSADYTKKRDQETHTIAQKAAQVTFSMRAITFVTILFIPGIFVATFLSTGIFHFTDNEQSFRPKALKLYFIITLPLMAGAFIAWYLLFQFTRSRDKRESSAADVRISANV
ncbi:hypothetical protein CC78DRAFT_464874 [Lojkania enalia]|uniref:CorA-like transporter domain-containing protein n=1 Tax=Lojkania enalia TaxID=147567 RepID=A0A9P4K6N8_9PLEO|nr:hypothetical protein CC78DRAFT_464874 [Didymosphaeria enalia]